MKIYVKNPDKLRRFRIIKGYTQRDFAKQLRITNVRLCQIESVKDLSVSVKTANKIAQLLNVEWSDIFDFR